MSKQQLNIITAILLVSYTAFGPGVSFGFELGKKESSVNALKLQALSILKDALNSKSPLIRTHAVEVAVSTGQKDYVPQICKLAKDPSVPVRFAAVVGLGDMGNKEHMELIHDSLNDTNVNVRIAAAYSLVKLGQTKYSGPLLAAAKNADQTVRANAVLLIGKLGNRDHLKLLHEVMTLKDSTDKVRMQAVESISRLGDEEMYRSKLWALQISKYADDRVVGIRGMGALNSPESKQAIVTMLQDDILEVRLAAAEQLARLGNNSGEQEVYSYFQTNPDLNKASMASGMAVMAIGYLKSNRLNNYLPTAISSKDPYIRVVGAQSVLLQVK